MGYSELYREIKYFAGFWSSLIRQRVAKSLVFNDRCGRHQPIEEVYMEQLSEKIITKCLTKQLSIASLARQSGVPKATIHGWMTGRSPKNLANVKKVADVLGVPIGQLIFGDTVDSKSNPIAVRESLNEVFRGEVRIIIEKI